MEDAATLERQGREQLERATTADELEDARVETLGRSSALTLALRELGALPAELRMSSAIAVPSAANPALKRIAACVR